MQETIFSQPFEVEIPPLTVAKDRIISANPEEEVITRLRNWAQEQGVDLAQARAFGFDVPISAAEKAQGLRGYEYWLQVPDSFVVPAQAGIHAVLNKEWMPDQVEHDVRVETFPGGTYIALRITDPFADPFKRIPQGWQTLVKYIKDNNNKSDASVIPSKDGIQNPLKNWIPACAGMTNDKNWCTPGSCLEEVKIIDGVCYMDLMKQI